MLVSWSGGVLMFLWLFGRVFGIAWKVVWWCVNASVVVW